MARVCFHSFSSILQLLTYLLIGLKDLLLSAFVIRDYSQLFHLDDNDSGPTVIARMTDTDPNAPSAYHLLQPTLECNGKHGVVCIQGRGSFTVFFGSEIVHNSSMLEHGPNPMYPCLGVGCVLKQKVLNVSKERHDVLDDFVCFPVLKSYYGITDD